MLAGTESSRAFTAIEFGVAGAGEARGAAKTAVKAVKAAKIPKARIVCMYMCGWVDYLSFWFRESEVRLIKSVRVV